MSEKKYNTELIHKAKQLNRTKNDKYIPLNPSGGEVAEGVKYEPKRKVDVTSDEKWKPGDRIVHKSKTGKSGRSIYEDNATWE